MVRHLFLTAAVLAAAPAANGELIDARLLPGGEGTRIWLAFDSQPSSAEASLDGPIAVLTISGVSASARVVTPSGGPVGRLALIPGGEAMQARLEGAWTAASAEVREGGVLVTLQGAPSVDMAPAPPAVARAEPDGPASGLTSAAALRASMRESREAAEAAPAPEPSGASSAEPAAEPEPAPEPVRQAEAATAPSRPGDPCADSGAAMEASPWDLEALSGHGACLTGEGRTREAQNLYERVLAFEPEHFEAALGLARVRAMQGDRAGAAALFELAEAAAHTDGQALSVRAAARELLGN
ncbi:tetratricopeptide repeat protein [Glycocaulis profundi]|nr:tetratricopeptide repeat protein [Glycocaulis profundi]